MRPPHPKKVTYSEETAAKPVERVDNILYMYLTHNCKVPIPNGRHVFGNLPSKL
jgi:hypothetical protein